MSLPPADRSGRSSSLRRTPSAGNDPEPTPPPPDSDEAPTVISAAQPRVPGADSGLGKNLAGRRLGPFELIEPIGVGGMAAVIRARDLDLGRTVALKILPPEMAVDPENITRFRSEARAAAKLDHENIARVYHCGEDQGLHFIAFEFVEGQNLRALLEQRGPLPVDECVHYMIQVAAGLAHAAARGVVHRDIKPSNILITPQGRAKIVDMGLARHLDPHPSHGSLTQSGVTLGTFDYISPEQALEPRAADVRSDIYSLGCTFYHALTGVPPVPEGTAAKKLHHHQHVQPLDPRQLNPAIPDDLTAVLGRMMAKDPARRYQTPEHLIQHLLQVARTRNLPTDALPAEASEVGPPADAGPLPQPPRLAALLIGVAAVVLLAAVLLGGGFGGAAKEPTLEILPPEEPPAGPLVPELTAGPGPGPAGRLGDPPPAPRPGVREAATVQELVELLRQGAPHVRLTGTVYDLTAVSFFGGEAPAALFQGPELTLEADRGRSPFDPPVVVRLGYAPPDDGRSPRPGALTFRRPAPGTPAAEGPVRVRLVGIRFEIARPPAGPAGGDYPPLAALTATGLDRLELERCEFLAEPSGLPDTAAVAVRSVGPAAPTAVRFDQCYFARGAVAVRLAGPAEVTAADCAFAPHSALFHARGGSGGDGPPARLTLERCSAMLEGGAVAELESDVACVIEAGHCLFSDPSARPADDPAVARMPGVELPGRPRRTAVVVRQNGVRAAATAYRPRLGAGRPMPNGYHRVEALEEGQQVYSFAQCLEQGLLSFHDEGAVLLAASPWRSPEPLRLLADRPREAFAVDTDLPRLRVPWREGSAGEAVLGVLTFRGGDLYPGLPLARPEVAELPPNRKVWDPRLSRTTGKFPPGVYSSLTDALSAVQPGDVLLVRYTGLLPIDPQELAKVNQRDLTIRPDEGYRPVLTLSQSERASAALFKVFNGRLVLEGLQFDLRSLQPEKELSRGVVTVVGGGECVLRDCVVTLEEASDVAFAAVRIDDPEGEMKPGVADTLPAPQVRLENSWVRGRGDLLAVSPSRPFEFAFDNGLAALDGSLVRVEAGDKNGPAAGVSAVRLRRVTTYLTEHLLHLQARPDEGASPGLVPVEVTAADCAFAPAGPYALAFVQVDHVAGEAALRERGLLAWKDARNNVYGYSDQHAMLRIDPGDGGEMMPPKPFGVDKWLAFTLEEGRPFTRVRFAAQFVPGQPLTAVRPDDFRIRALDPPPLPEPDPETLGANADRLPVLFSDRDEEPPPPQG